MNSQEAKFTLQAYRHHPVDQADPHLAEALAQVRRDPELAQWLEEDQALFEQMSRSLAAVPVPPELRGQILAGARMSRPPLWWQQPAWLAAAALLVLAATTGLFWMTGPRDSSLAQFREAMTEQLSRLDHLDHQDPRPDALRQWLADHAYPADFELPSSLRDGSSIGCRLLDWDRRKVSLVCFSAGEGRAVHLFVMDRPDKLHLPETPGRSFTPSGEWQTTAWATRSKVYLLAGSREEDLRKVL